MMMTHSCVFEVKLQKFLSSFVYSTSSVATSKKGPCCPTACHECHGADNADVFIGIGAQTKLYYIIYFLISACPRHPNKLARGSERLCLNLLQSSGFSQPSSTVRQAITTEERGPKSQNDSIPYQETQLQGGEESSSDLSQY